MKKLACIFAVLFAAALTVIRSWQNVWIIEEFNGFFASESFTVPLLYILLGAFVVLAIVLAFADKDCHETEPTAIPTVSGFLTFLMSVAIAVMSFVMLFITINNGAASTQEIFTYILAIVAGVVLIYVGVRMMSGKPACMSHMKLLPIVVLVWVVFKLIVLFKTSTSVLNMSGNLFELLSLVCMTLFFMYFAYALAGVETLTSRRMIMVSGLVGVVLLFSHNISLLWAAARGAIEPKGAVWYMTRYSDLAVAVLILAVCAGIAFAPKQAVETNDNQADGE